MIMNIVTAYLKSSLGILKLTCLFAIALVVALSSYSHFNSHWVYHSRMVDREEVATFNLSGRDRLTELRNEYEECRYNSRLYTGISMIDSPEKVNGFGAREYESAPENVCPHPVMELFLVITSICILIVSLLSLMTISIWLPAMVAEERSIKFYRIFDMVLFCLAVLFLFISVVMFWYSTDNISEWCSLKTSMVAFSFKSGRSEGASRSSLVVADGGKSGGIGKKSLTLQHDDTVDIITGSEQNDALPVQAYQMPPAESNQVPLTQYSRVSRNTILIPTAGPPAVLYLTRVKRESPESIEVRFLEPSNHHNSRSLSEFDIELQKIRQDQYMELCNVRQMTNEKYFAVAAAIIALLLHIVVIVLIFKKCGRSVVNDLQRQDEEVQQHPDDEDLSKNNNRPKSGQESRPKSDQNNNHNTSDVPSDNYKSDASHPYAKNDNSMDTRSPNDRRTSNPNEANERRTSYPNDSYGRGTSYDTNSRQNESGQGNLSTQAHHHHHQPKTHGMN